MNKLKTLVGMSGLVVALGGWSVANAATYNFDFAVKKAAAESLIFTGKESGSGTGTLNVTVSGGSNKPIQAGKKAIVQSWSGNGLGVINDATWSSFWRKWNYSDDHQVDNKGSADFALFDFGQNVKIESVTLQAFGDVDITVNSGSIWDAGLIHVAGNKPKKVNGSTFLEVNLANLAIPNSDLWRIFAKIGDRDDKFKISSMTVSTPSTPSAVPIPAAVWLFGSALVGMVGIGRRRQIKQS